MIGGLEAGANQLIAAMQAMVPVAAPIATSAVACFPQRIVSALATADKHAHAR